MFSPFRVYINGQPIGTLFMGKKLVIEVPRATVYYIDSGNFYDENAVVYDRGQRECHVLLKSSRRQNSETHREFYIEDNRILTCVPAFHFDDFFSVIFKGEAASFSADEEVLLRCLEFDCTVTENLHEALANIDLYDTVHALKTIGAQQCADLLLNFLRHDLAGASLPLSDAYVDRLQAKIERANKQMRDDKAAHEEFHKAVVRYITAKLDFAKYVF